MQYPEIQKNFQAIKNYLISNFKTEIMKISDPKGLLQQKSMNIYAEKGHKVTVTEQSIINGHDSDKKKAKKFLKVGGVYTVESMEVYSWSSTVKLQEIPNQEFNSVNFIDLVCQHLKKKRLKKQKKYYTKLEVKKLLKKQRRLCADKTFGIWTESELFDRMLEAPEPEML